MNTNVENVYTLLLRLPPVPPVPPVLPVLPVLPSVSHLFFVMNAVMGGDLYHLLKQLPGRKCPESWVQLYTAEIITALAYLHRHRIIFRDLKPENILVAMDGHLQVRREGGKCMCVV